MPLIELLKKQGYHIIGNHSAIKPCLWLGRSIKGQGSCYKAQFYGITSHRCMQMTPCVACNQRCLHCWRPVEEPFTVTKWDSPESILEGCLKEQQRFISGYGGIPETDKSNWKEAFKPKHAAISLVGEPTLYPQLEKLVELCHEREMSTFIVTNGTRPEVLEKITPSQLYMSLDAPDHDTYMKACNPVADLWDRVNKSLEVLGSRENRRALRLTLVKGVNMIDPEGYGALIKKAKPDYVEVKAYMHLGYSRNRLPREAMPRHEEVLAFADQVAEACGYKRAMDVELSRVALLSRDGSRESAYAGEIYTIQYHNVDRQAEMYGLMSITDSATLHQAMADNGVNYVFVGTRESAHPFVEALADPAFFTLVYDVNNVKVYEVEGVTPS